MTLSPDGESVEVSTLISRDSQEDLSNLMSLFHAIMAVLDSDLCSLTMFKLSPFILNNTGLNLQCLRNKFTNELIGKTFVCVCFSKILNFRSIRSIALIYSVSHGKVGKVEHVIHITTFNDGKYPFKCNECDHRFTQ